MHPSLSIVALGSNLGDSSKLITRAMDRLQSLSTAPIKRSSLWQTTPVDCPPGSPAFFNAVVGITPAPDETPESLLDKLQAIEWSLGRRPKRIPNESRTIDLDLITFGNATRSTKRLILPHPRAHVRRFVLAPLNEIAPDLLLPGQKRSVNELLAGCTSDESVRRLD